MLVAGISCKNRPWNGTDLKHKSRAYSGDIDTSFVVINQDGVSSNTLRINCSLALSALAHSPLKKSVPINARVKENAEELLSKLYTLKPPSIIAVKALTLLTLSIRTSVNQVHNARSVRCNLGERRVNGTLRHVHTNAVPRVPALLVC
jgi:hypothetical protein